MKREDYIFILLEYIDRYCILIHRKINLVDNHTYKHYSKLGNYIFLNQIKNKKKDKYKPIESLSDTIGQTKFRVSLR